MSKVFCDSFVNLLNKKTLVTLNGTLLKTFPHSYSAVSYLSHIYVCVPLLFWQFNDDTKVNVAWIFVITLYFQVHILVFRPSKINMWYVDIPKYDLDTFMNICKFLNKLNCHILIIPSFKRIFFHNLRKNQLLKIPF